MTYSIMLEPHCDPEKVRLHLCQFFFSLAPPPNLLCLCGVWNMQDSQIQQDSELKLLLFLPLHLCLSNTIFLLSPNQRTHQDLNQSKWTKNEENMGLELEKGLSYFCQSFEANYHSSFLVFFLQCSITSNTQRTFCSLLVCVSNDTKNAQIGLKFKKILKSVP